MGEAGPVGLGVAVADSAFPAGIDEGSIADHVNDSVFESCLQMNKPVEVVLTVPLKEPEQDSPALTSLLIEFISVFGFGLGVATCLSETPLFQTRFFPDFMQVYLMFAMVLVEFTLEHLVPAIAADLAGRIEIKNVAATKVATRDNLVRDIV